MKVYFKAICDDYGEIWQTGSLKHNPLLLLL